MNAKPIQITLPTVIVIEYGIPATRMFTENKEKLLYERSELVASRDKDTGKITPIDASKRTCYFDITVDVKPDEIIGESTVQELLISTMRDKMQYMHTNAFNRETWEGLKVGKRYPVSLRALITPKTRVKRESIETQINNLREAVKAGDMTKPEAQKRAQALKTEAIKREQARLAKLEEQDVKI